MCSRINKLIYATACWKFKIKSWYQLKDVICHIGLECDFSNNSEALMCYIVLRKWFVVQFWGCVLSCSSGDVICIDGDSSSETSHSLHLLPSNTSPPSNSPSSKDADTCMFHLLYTLLYFSMHFYKVLLFDFPCNKIDFILHYFYLY